MKTYLIASAGQRITAGAIDVAVYAVLQLILGGALSLVGLSDLGELIALLYLLLRDSLPFLNYQSIGKKAIRLKVLQGGNRKIDYFTGIKRNFIFLPNLFNAFGLSMFYVGGAITMILIIIEIYLMFEKEYNQRLGDKISDTQVIVEEV